MLYQLSVVLLLITGLRVGFIFVVYLTTLSVTRTVQRQMAEWLVNGKGKGLPVYATEIYRGRRSIAPRILKISGQHDASSVLNPAKKRRYPFNRGLAGSQRQTGRFRKTNILPCWDSNPGSPRPYHSHYTDWAIGKDAVWSCRGVISHIIGAYVCREWGKARNPASANTLYGPRFEAGTPITIIYNSSTSLGTTEFQHSPETNLVTLNTLASDCSETLKHIIPYGVEIKITTTWAVLGQSRPWSTALWHFVIG